MNKTMLPSESAFIHSQTTVYDFEYSYSYFNILQ